MIERLKAEALERRTAERRAASVEAVARHFAIVERRTAERRAADAARVADWIRRFEAARMERGRA